MGMIINQILSYDSDRNKIMRGYLKGYIKALINIREIMSYNNKPNLSKFKQYL